MAPADKLLGAAGSTLLINGKAEAARCAAARGRVIDGDARRSGSRDVRGGNRGGELRGRHECGCPVRTIPADDGDAVDEAGAIDGQGKGSTTGSRRCGTDRSDRGHGVVGSIDGEGNPV